MKRLFPNTLRDIARHTDKTVKLADFLTKAELDLNVSVLAKIDPQTDPVELIEAFDKDLSKTSNSIFDVWELVKTADSSHVVHHLKNPEKNLKKIFGEKYDESKRTISFKGFEIDLTKEYDTDHIKALMVKSITGLDFDSYQELKNRRKKIFRFNDADLNTDFDKVQYLSAIKEVEQYKDVIENIRSIAASYLGSRNRMGSNSLNVIDQEITFERAMIDSVVNTSTYISKTIGIEQASKKHKNDAKAIKSLQDAIDRSKLVEAVEVDQDASIEAMIFALKELDSIKPNMSNESKRLIFKARKLGNYNANGLYVDAGKILAVDIKSPSSIIHELTHAIDFNNEEIRQSKARSIMVSTLREHMNIDEMSEVMPANKVNYYNRDTEIIARMGEIGFLLNKFDYSPNEPFETFCDRVRAAEASVDNPYELNLSHSIDHYLTHENIYFNIATMQPEILMNVRKFSRAFFGVNGQEPESVNDFKIEKAPTLKLGERSPSSRYQMKSVSLINEQNIEFILNYNRAEKVIDPVKLLEHIFTQTTHLDRTTLSHPKGKGQTQKAIVKKVVDWVKKENDPILTKAVIDNLLEIGFYEKVGRTRCKETVDTYTAKVTREGIASGKPMIFSTIRDKYAEEVAEKDKAYKDAIEDARNYSDEVERIQKLEKIDQAKAEWIIAGKKASDEFRALEESELPEATSLASNRYKYWHADTKKSGTYRGKAHYTNTHFLSEFRESMTEPMREFAIEALKGDHKSIMNLLTMEDDLLYVLANDEAFRSKFEESELKSMDKHLSGIIAANGLLDYVFEQENMFLYNSGSHLKKMTSKAAPLNVFDINDMGFKNVFELEIAMIKGEVKPSRFYGAAPEIFSEWCNARNTREKMLQEYADYTFKPVTVENVEKLINEAFNTVDYLNDFTAELEGSLSNLVVNPRNQKTILDIATEEEEMEALKIDPRPEPLPKPKEKPTEKPKPMSGAQISLF
ncbi:hypothetical protein QTV49_003924 [Vibrio vulnificus]|nr:hypothetical protein [Vibrio vulnificus]